MPPMSADGIGPNLTIVITFSLYTALRVNWMNIAPQSA